jgi:riboflavin synthase
MFTGLIEAVGHVGQIAQAPAGLRISIRTSMAADLSDGESVSVNGVCLTIAQRDPGAFSADIGPETARVTTLGSLAADQPVNLERAMRAGGIGTVRELRAEGDAHWLRVSFSPALAPFFVLKGSVAMDGVSLTVAGLDDDHFDVMIIPFTWEHTSLGSLQMGVNVNLECDVVGKYVARAVQLFGSA